MMIFRATMSIFHPQILIKSPNDRELEAMEVLFGSDWVFWFCLFKNFCAKCV